MLEGIEFTIKAIIAIIASLVVGFVSVFILVILMNECASNVVCTDILTIIGIPLGGIAIVMTAYGSFSFLLKRRCIHRPGYDAIPMNV